jgi:hypothetical protein
MERRSRRLVNVRSARLGPCGVPKNPRAEDTATATPVNDTSVPAIGNCLSRNQERLAAADNQLADGDLTFPLWGSPFPLNGNHFPLNDYPIPHNGNRNSLLPGNSIADRSRLLPCFAFRGLRSNSLTLRDYPLETAPNPVPNMV